MSERVILHSDMNCFYASVEMLHHPEFAGMPLAVGGNPEARHGIVLTANYIAKQKGVKTGMALWQEKHICTTTDGFVFEIFTDGKRNLFGVYGQDRAIWD